MTMASPSDNRLHRAQTLLRYVITPAVNHLSMYGIPATRTAEMLLLGTAFQESGGGIYRRQLGGGPALGIFQMEPATHTDIWENFLRYRGVLAEGVRETRYSPNVPDVTPADQLASNALYAAAMARVHYYRVPEALPVVDWTKGDDEVAAGVAALARYWKAHYNTPEGAGRVEEFDSNFPYGVLV